MTNDRHLQLSRRKVLGGLGTIGLASAGAGLGTSAYFSDDETFEDNVLTAGELDLTVDWEEHYWNDFELPDDLEIEYVEDESDVGDGQVGFPVPTNPMVAVDGADLDTFMDATAIEAYPDSDNNRIQDNLSEYDECDDFAQLATDLNPDGLRSSNPDTWIDGIEAGDPAPLINLHDVKPGDFGELTLSFHLCDNPGYVWLQGEPVEARENGTTEPEGDEDAETGDSDEVAAGIDVLSSDVELLDAIQTCLWYDDGDNVFEPTIGEDEEVDLTIVFDQSESMNSGLNSGSNDVNPEKLDAAVSGAKSLIDTLGGSVDQSLVCFSDTDATQIIRQLGSSKADIKQDLDALNGPDTPQNTRIDDNQDYNHNLVDDNQVDSEGNGSQTDSDGDDKDDDNLILDTDLGGGIQVAHNHLTNDGRSGARKVMVVLSDGKPWNASVSATGAASDAKDDGVEIYSIAYGDDADEGLMETIASDPENTHAFSGGEADIGAIFGEIGQSIGGEEKFFDGTLRELLGELTSGSGIPLDGDGENDFDETGGNPDSESRGCFSPTPDTNFIGMAWWIPAEYGNAIQSDSIMFDLGFYTEQCRHNDGSGMGDDTDGDEDNGGPATARFATLSKIVTVAGGEEGEIPIELENTNSASLVVGSDDLGYAVSLDIHDGDDDGIITLQWDTAIAGQTGDESQAWATKDSADAVSNVQRTTSQLNSDLAFTAYPMSLSVGSTETDVGLVVIEDPDGSGS